tara:strand:+ start:139 stop:318 length:180 start_codon:yes stop_codon:yes gene_type:complete
VIQGLDLSYHKEKLTHHVTEQSHSEEKNERANQPLDVADRIVVPKPNRGQRRECKVSID